MEKSCRKCALKSSPRFLFSFGKYPNSHCMQEVPLKIRYFERGLSEDLKKVTFIFAFEPSPF